MLSWIREGARCEWRQGPPPPYNHGVSLARPDELSAAQSAFLEAEAARCYATGAWEDAPPDERTHICRVHLVPKKVPPGAPPKWRVVVDLRPTNAYCVDRRCKYETLKALSRLARRGEWDISWDMQDGYHQVGIHRDSRRYMTFALPPAPGSPPGTPPRYIRCAALPFGWNASPLIFTKVMRVMVRMLRSPVAPTAPRLRRRTLGRAYVLRLRRCGRRGASRGAPSTTHPFSRQGDVNLRGMRILPYVDDFLALARTRREALACREQVQRVVEFLGLTHHPGKGEWEPTQRLEHLGLDVDLEAGLFRVPPHKLAALMRQAREILGLASREARLVPARLLAGFIGYAQSVYLACPSARFYLRALHDVLATRTSWGARVRLSRQALRDLGWWREIGSADVARAIWRAPEQSTLHCDASRLAWGGVLDGTVPAQGMWTGRERGRHINYLELLAVHQTLCAFLGRLHGRSVLLWEDNMTVVHVLTNRTTRSPELMHLLRRVWYLLDSAGIDLSVRHIATDLNVLADSLSRGSPFDDLTLLPNAFASLERRFGPHDVDRYATSANTQLSRWNGLMPDARSDGAGALSQRWEDENNYAFPPVTELPRIAQLLHEHPGVACTLVAPYWPAQAWFQQLSELATHAEVRALHEVARPPAWLPASARHGLTGAMLIFFRVAGRLGSR